MPHVGPVHLRRAEPVDAAGIAEVQVLNWRMAHEPAAPGAPRASPRVRQREESWRSELEVEARDRKPWLALVDERVVGFASGGLSREPHPEADIGEVYEVAVSPECRGRGIGRTLLGHVTRDLRAHGFTRATLWVAAEDIATRHWLEGQGWVFDGTTRDEGDGEPPAPAVRYTRRLR